MPSTASPELDRRQSITRLLVAAFGRKRPGKKELATIVRWTEAEGDCPSDEEIFAFLTAFTHPRRLQILRWLAQHGPSARPAIAGALSMSGDACHRHLDRLLRRGMVVRQGISRGNVYRLNLSIGSKFGSQLLAKVLSHLKTMGNGPTHVNV